MVGSLRPYGLAKYFIKFGWEAIVLTADHPGKSPKGMRVIKAECKDITGMLKSKIGLSPGKGLHQQLGISLSKDDSHTRLKKDNVYTKCKKKIIKLVIDVINYPDSVKRGWYKFALEAASEFLSKERVDVIISTSPPITSHLIARKLKKKYEIPWVADFRDLWSQSPYIDKLGLIRFFGKRLEWKTLSDADRLVVVTKPWINTFKAVYKDKKIFCVTNGFDEDDFPELPSKLTTKFTLTYTGSLYNGKRDPSLLFEVIAKLINENRINKDLIEIRFFVQKEDWFIDEIKQNNLEGVVKYYGHIPREEVLIKQRESQVLLLLLWDNKNEEGFCPAKVYEYLAAHRPIVAIGGREHVVKDLLETTNAGKYTWNPDILKNVLLDYYDEFIKIGEVKCYSNSSIANYTYNLITEKYSDILNGLVLN